MDRSGVLAFEERAFCPGCGATGGSVMVDLPFDQEPISSYLRAFYGGSIDPDRLSSARYVLIDCPSCGLVYQRDVLDHAGLDELYSVVVSGTKEQIQRARGLDVRRSYSFQVEHLIKHAAKPPSEVRVLDFGGGWGLWLDMARGYGCQTAIAELARPKSEAPYGGHPVYGLDDLPHGHFDFVNTEQVVEHLTHPGPVLKRLAASLRLGGLLRVSVPNGSDICQRLAGADWSAPKPRSTDGHGGDRVIRLAGA